MPLVGSELPQAPSGYLRTVIYNGSNNCVPHIKAHSPAMRENAHCPHYPSLLAVMDLPHHIPSIQTCYHLKHGAYVHKGKEPIGLSIQVTLRLTIIP